MPPVYECTGELGDELFCKLHSAAVNLGPNVNSKGDEWAPTPGTDGSKLLFASDGRGGLGMHDLFVSERTKDGWGEARALPEPLNSEEDDFDGTWLHDGQTLVFSRKPKDKEEMHLYVARLTEGAWSTPQRLSAAVNVPGGWNLGPSINAKEPGVLYFTSSREGTTQGRLDIYRIRYKSSSTDR